ncbi:MAG: hypothetical protein A3C79_00955 [Candidatus Taylorbacteria bacterium RIFCSPHIGHO2_02_FULL_45_28]|uniref:DUF7282 domain-containing protein n=1 Tax=Candidatus Taylorbacteria bacterium RIFCSPHIGHO2_12_FULL_45_16 TaxID=1802315 RepID=A0A1G2MZ71_9BACT|nr:MAG: hypothetical protein A2830_02205 [Candidatus Taylorbacteria bacterium RIFCSPHIGHO2_01_FULL_44_110]OHA25589.1 MAG: hypothetical protein A3C79_00955 [Candidatus Taylorbacteria bacterium RIFCSPHIGHO2_02_FULL_45_28]OHA29255.1 MAG: hypothetical protein A3F51_01420 [Candidatus Taylorbacteria bacterium RIFCSPHIGHO2_12_FULL_45_16]OHA33477.1 MAG: hypothetical protein A3A23_02300 [Candidatus Taylorbacteria bacterium RIFCSPLOWO2_01_FULL_45_59]OHA39193.1 MAG: hypothetical protein A3I98_01990 [Candi
MEPSSGIKTWQWVVTVIVIIVLIIIGIMVFGNDKASDQDDLGTDIDTTDTTASIEANRVVLGDQFPGNVVFLSSVQLANGGWVVIHKDNAGIPGEIIGSMYFNKGINTGKITLTKPTTEGGIYYAMLHSDDGDKVFDDTKDLPLKDSKGNTIMKLFRATAAVGAGLKG